MNDKGHKMEKMNIKVEPLSESDYGWIEQTLDKYQEEGSIQSAFSLDGFLSAIVISPQDIPPHIWLPFIFNDQSGAKWESEEEEERFIKLVMNWFYEIFAARQGQDEYNPMFTEHTHQSQPFILVAPWSHGFLRGSYLWMDFDDMEAKAKLHFHELVMPALISTPESYEEILGELTDEQRNDWDNFYLDQISDLHLMMINHLEKLSQIWHPITHKTPVVHDAPKIGRNDPCTCGSGKKYKKCCGKK
tara:strand:- start:40 stop:777 length:738 start_codon:yes stop_codon:yes gene_type:complete